MRQSAAKVTKKVKVKKANGFAFFSLTDNDNVIECNDPCHCFIPIDEVADSSSLINFIEVYSDEPEILESMPVQKPLAEIFEFKEIDICGECDGRILVASVEAGSGIIFFQKENQVLVSDHIIYDDDNVEEEYNLSPFQRKMTVCNWDDWRHRKGENYKPIRNNRKTLPDRKVQRENRSLLREVKCLPVEELDFYEGNFSLIDTFN